jgi:hypothetical protein
MHLRARVWCMDSGLAYSDGRVASRWRTYTPAFPPRWCLSPTSTPLRDLSPAFPPCVISPGAGRSLLSNSLMRDVSRDPVLDRGAPGSVTLSVPATVFDEDEKEGQQR